MQGGCFCASYLEGESVLAGAEPHVLHLGAVDHHLSHISAGHKHWLLSGKSPCVCRPKCKKHCRHPQHVFLFSDHLATQHVQSWHCANALQSCRLLHNVVISKYGVMRSCIHSKGEQSLWQSCWGCVVVELDAFSDTKAWPNFPFQMKAEFVYSPQCVRALLEEGFKQDIISVPHWKTRRLEMRRRAAFSRSILSLVLSGQRPQAWGLCGHLLYRTWPDARSQPRIIFFPCGLWLT